MGWDSWYTLLIKDRIAMLTNGPDKREKKKNGKSFPEETSGFHFIKIKRNEGQTDY